VSEQHYASVTNPHVNALVTGRYRFEHEKLAIRKMEYLRKNFTTARQQATEDAPVDKEVLVLWIRDFSVTPEEAEQGFLGHYAFVTPEQLGTGTYTLACVKLDTELKYHPRRTRKKARLPNWGHPILRAVKKQKHYPTLAAIQAELDALHLEYPETTIPADNKLLLMIFDRQADEKNPAQKYVIKIITDKEGGYTYEYSKNEYEGRIAVKEPGAGGAETASDAQAEVPQGYFTSMVALKRKKKAAPKKSARSAPKEASGESE
jgi:hypothetical protein